MDLTMQPWLYNEFAHSGVEEMTKMAGEEFAAEAVLHYREEFSTFDWIMEEMLTRTGFSIRHKKVLTLTRIDYLCET